MSVANKKKFIHNYSIFAVLLILISAWLFAGVEARPRVFEPYLNIIQLFDYFVLLVFLTEFLCRIIFSKNRWGYLFSFDGTIDIIAILPSLCELVLGAGISVTWIRVLRLIRIARMLKAFKYHSWLQGITGKILPYALFVFGIEAIIYGAEAKGYWSTPENLNIALGVAGFSVAVMLGAKLSVVNARMYSIEDSICRIVGSMRDMWFSCNIKKELIAWSTYFESFITSKKEDKLNMASKMRDKTDELERLMEENKVGGPNSAGFHRDSAFLIHRATATIPKAYDHFLRTVVVLYMFVIIISVSGLTGVIASLLSVFVLGGLYYLVDDMDDPLSFQENSFIDARIEALTYWNEAHSRQTD